MFKALCQRQKVSANRLKKALVFRVLIAQVARFFLSPVQYTELYSNLLKIVKLEYENGFVLKYLSSR